jgi:alpha-tubulin suppressor-like RCC1 family protein
MPVQSAASGAVAMAAGREHVLILTKDGELKAWGSNRHGQLARSREGMHADPVKIGDLDSSVRSIASGGYHLMVIAADSTLRAWGHNKFGQLGDRSRDYRYEPVLALAQPMTAASEKKGADQPRSVSDNAVVMVAGGRNHSVALKADGSVWAWGDNFSGQLGDGERRTINPYPQQVRDISRVKAIAAGTGHTLALREDGTVWAWGTNEFRQVGDGTKAQNRALPVQVAGLAEVVAIAAGNIISLAVRNDGTVWSWGVHPNSPGANMAQVAPVQVPGLANIVAVSAGGMHALALAKDGTVWGWCDKMFGNMYGQVGDGSTVVRPMPVRVAGLTDVVAVATGGKHSVALKKDGTVWAWGLMRQLTSKDILAACDVVPTQVPGIQDAAAVAAGEEHTIVLKRDGSLWGWGKSAQHQLGNQAFTTVPVAIANIANVAKVAAGWYHNLAVLKDGKLLSWGLNEYGQIGDGSQGLTEHGSKRFNKGSVGKMHPAPVNWSAPVSAAKSEPSSTRPEIKSISAGGSHSALLMTDGTVWTWGDHTFQQLGARSGRSVNGKPMSPVHHRPFPVSSLKDIQAIDAGPYHTLALKTDGTVVEWGRSYADVVWAHRTDNMTVSQLIAHERDISRERGAPAKAMNDAVGELTDVASVTAGYGFSLALRRDGTVWAWGKNEFGQLGDGTMSSRKAPRPVPGLSDVQALASGQSYVLALKTDGSVWAWGAVGRKSPSMKLHTLMKPVKIDGLSDVTAIAGGHNAFALKSDGSVWNCWQWDREDASRFDPAPVSGLTGVRAISARSAHLLTLMNDGSVRMVRHQLPEAKDRGKQTGELVDQVEEISDAVEIAAGGGHSLVMKRDGTLLVWGMNDAGQLGDVTETASEMPLKLRFP